MGGVGSGKIAEKYKGYDVPVCDISNLTKEHLSEGTGICLGFAVNVRSCNACSRCILVAPNTCDEKGMSREVLLEYMIEKGYITKSDVLEITLMRK